MSARLPEPLPRTVIVVGAGGFVGRNLVASLSGRIERLIGVTASGRPVPGCGASVSLPELAALGPFPAETALVHLGAYRYDAGRFGLVQSDILVNDAALAGRVFHACAELGIREVRLASSVAVYPAEVPVMDDAVPVALDRPPHAGEAFYAWSKRLAEVMAGLYAAQYGISTLSFRLSNPYGPHDSTDPAKAHVAPAFVMKALSPDPVFTIRGDPSVERDFVYVGDVVEVLVRSLARRGEGGAFNLATGASTTLLDFARTALRVAGADKPIESGAPGAFGPAVRRSTGARVRAAFGVEFRDLASGLGPTIDWYRDALRT